MMSKEMLALSVKAALDAREYKYGVVDLDEDHILVTMKMGLYSLFTPVEVDILIDDEDIIIVTSGTEMVDEEHRCDTAEYLLRTQEGLKHGHYDLDVDGTIRFFNCVEGWMIPYMDTEAIMHSILTGCKVFKRFGNGLFKVMVGCCKDMEEEITQARADLGIE